MSYIWVYTQNFHTSPIIVDNILVDNIWCGQYLKHLRFALFWVLQICLQFCFALFWVLQICLQYCFWYPHIFSNLFHMDNIWKFFSKIFFPNFFIKSGISSNVFDTYEITVNLMIRFLCLFFKSSECRSYWCLSHQCSIFKYSPSRYFSYKI